MLLISYNFYYEVQFVQKYRSFYCKINGRQKSLKSYILKLTTVLHFKVKIISFQKQHSWLNLSKYRSLKIVKKLHPRTKTPTRSYYFFMHDHPTQLRAYLYLIVLRFLRILSQIRSYDSLINILRNILMLKDFCGNLKRFS